MLAITAPSKPIRLIRCTLGRDSFGMAMDKVQSIERADRIIWTLQENGAVARAGQGSDSWPVFSLAQILGKSFAAPPEALTLIRFKGDFPWGLLVERVHQAGEFPDYEFKPVPESLIHEMGPIFTGVITTDEGLLLVLSPEGLQNHKKSGEIPGPKKSSPAPKRALQLPESRHSRRGQILLCSPVAWRSERRPLICGLSLTQVLEIIDWPGLVSTGSKSNGFLGLVNWKNRPVSVFDLAKTLGLPPDEKETDIRLVIIRPKASTDLVGFKVRSFLRLLRMPVRHQPSSRDLEVREELLLGAFELKNETLLLLDLRAFILKGEARSENKTQG